MGNDGSKQNTDSTRTDDYVIQRLKQSFSKLCEASISSNCTALDKKMFEEHVIPDVSLLADALFSYMLPEKPPSDKGVDEGTFVEKGNVIVELRGLSDQTRFYVQLFATDPDKITKQDTEIMLESAYQCALLECNLPAVKSNKRSLCVEPAVHSLLGREESVEICRAVSWLSRNCESVTNSLHQYTCTCLLSQRRKPENAAQQRVSEPHNPTLCQQLCDERYLLTLSRSWMLSCLLPSNYFTLQSTESLSNLSVLLSGGWRLLYNSEEQGLSVNRFQHHVFSYEAPTVTLFLFEGHCYCIAASKGWREGSSQTGGDSCFLVQLYPQFKLMQSGANLFFLNFKNKDLPKGLQIGTDSKTRFLQIDAGFHKVKHYSVDYQLYRLETWGCGGLTEHEKQLKQREWEKNDALRQRERKLKLEDWESSPDRLLLGWGGVNVDHANTDRDMT